MHEIDAARIAFNYTDDIADKLICDDSFFETLKTIIKENSVSEKSEMKILNIINSIIEGFYEKETDLEYDLEKDSR